MQRIGPTITFSLQDETRVEIERLAERHERTLSAMCRELMFIGLETYQTYEKLGIPQAAEILKRVRAGAIDQKQMRLA